MKKLLLELKKLYKQKRLQNRELIAIGRIEHIEGLQQMLEDLGLVLSAIVDNDSGKEGLIVRGVEIHKPEQYLLPFDDNKLILIYSPKYWQDISEQFSAMGYVEEKHYIVLQKPSVKSAILQVRRGHKIYGEITDKYGKEAKILVCRGPIGDFYLFGLYLDAYLKKEKIGKYVLVGDSKGFSKLADLFGIDHIYVLSEYETDCFVKAYIFDGGEKYNVHILTIWQKLSFNSCVVRYRQGFSFMDTVRSFSYNLPAEARKTVPEFSELGVEIEELCCRLGLVKNKTVILSPFAYSLQSLPMHFWQQLADALVENGYVVCVNIDVKKEKCELKNVIPINISFKEIAAVLQYAGYLIGIRSGFMDITSGAECKKIVLYPQYIQEKVSSKWHRTDMEFSSLKSMGLCDDAVELEYPVKDACGSSYMKNGRYDAKQCEKLIAVILKHIKEQ